MLNRLFGLAQKLSYPKWSNAAPINFIIMRNSFVLLDFKSKQDPDLDRFAQTVLKNMTGNPAFASIKSLIDTDLNNAVQAYSAALIANETGGKPATAAKNAARATLIGILDVVARHVDLIADGDEAVILGTGFEAGDAAHHIPKEISKAAIVSAKRGEAPCEAILEMAALPAAELFAVEWSVDNGQVWHNGTYSSRRKIKVVTTAPKTDTFFRVRGLGRKDRKGVWSDPTSLFVV